MTDKEKFDKWVEDNIPPKYVYDTIESIFREQSKCWKEFKNEYPFLSEELYTHKLRLGYYKEVGKVYKDIDIKRDKSWYILQHWVAHTLSDLNDRFEREYNREPTTNEIYKELNESIKCLRNEFGGYYD